MERLESKQERLAKKLKDYDIFILWEEEVVSTNEISAGLALDAKENLVVSDIQTGGLGRLGRPFISNKGGLYESIAICLNDIFPDGEQPDLNKTLHFPLLVALGTINAINNVCAEKTGIDVIPDIKWPNDIMIDGKKIGGILCKAAQNKGRWFFIAGIGINITNELPKDLEDASNLQTVLKSDNVDYEEFIEELAAAIYIETVSLLKKGITEAGQLLDEVEQHCITIGKKVIVPDKGISGIAIQIGDDGALCIETGNDEYEIIKSGDVVIYKD